MRHVGSMAFGAAAMLGTLWPLDMATARDRPGTPNQGVAFECRKYAALKYDAPPNACVMFTNTATERVRFDIEWMANGVKLSQEDFKGHVECARLVDPPFDPNGTQCVAGANLRGFLASSQLGNSINWGGFVSDLLAGEAPVSDSSLPREAFMVKNLEFDTEYCFRFKARDADSGVVSEEWSNWACAHTAPPPPKPQAPANLKATFTPAHWDGSRNSPPVPAHVDVTWTANSEYVAYLEFTEYKAPDEIERRDPGGMRMPDVGARQQPDRTKVYSARLPSARQSVVVNLEPGELAALPYRHFGVCAHNITGESCSVRVKIPSVYDQLDQPNPDATRMTDPYAGQRDARPPGGDVSLPHPESDRVGRRTGGFGTGMSTPPAQAGSGPTACASGYVWRVARGEDLVCVTPAARKRIARENADAHNHVDPAGAYGPNSCVGGYVWRGAFDGDAVCVTPEARALARQENAEGPGHRAGDDEIFRAPR